MKRTFILLIIIALFSLNIYSKGYNLFFGIGYGHGLSDFFEESKTNYNYDGKSFVDTRTNELGFNFVLNLSIPLSEKLSIIPGISMAAGNQGHSYEEITTSQQGESVSEQFSFNLFSGDIVLSYDVLSISKDIVFNVLGGFNYTIFNSDKGMMIEKTKYFGALIGFGIKFLQIDQFDLITNVMYNHAFNKDMPSFIKGQVGLRYKF